MADIALTRRQVIQTLLALCAGGVCLLGNGAAAASRSTSSNAAFRGRWNNANHDPTFENFRDLSAIITLQDDLDAQSARDIHKVLMDEPWGPSHMTRLHTKIGAALAAHDDNTRRAPMQDASWQFDDGEKWFARHVLEIWYTGLYLNAERPRARILYDTALMFGCAPALPVPLLQPLGFGNWADAPEKPE
ncbi:MAG: hypothetical protein IT560_08700 [Alphaproteobacteria bacterium]|nr:hypothetical protein [Alphaproteobacteria bacterium]